MRSVTSFLRMFAIGTSLLFPTFLWGQSVNHLKIDDQSQILQLAQQAGKDGQEEIQPAKVRIGLRLTPYRKMVTENPMGQVKTSFVPEPLVKRTLRARIDQMNHFYVGDYRIETNPLSFTKGKQLYKIRLNVYRQFGAYGQVEEFLGYLDLTGKLHGDKGLYVLHGANGVTLKNRLGEPVLEMAAGYRKAPKAVTTPLSQSHKSSEGTKRIGQRSKELDKTERL